MQKINNVRIADIHTHILPNIDDGASSSEESVRMLFAEERQGITDVVLTPHFNLANDSIQDFLTKRNTSFELLSEKIKENGSPLNVNLHLGAEVRYDPNLIYSDIFKLCYENTSYLLLELIGSYPFNFEQTVHWMLSRGVSPILAHVERYEYLISNPKLLEDLLYAGVVFQCNASSLYSKHYAKRVQKLIKNGYVQLLASDAHNMEKRPPELAKALGKTSKHTQMLIANSMKVIEDRLI